MAVAALDHPAHAAMVPQGFGAGGQGGGLNMSRATGYRAARQMLFTSWLYRVRRPHSPTFPKDATQEETDPLSRFF